MFDIGMLELLVIGIVALVVIGPKDLPGLFHTIGRFTAKARSMAREFTRAMEDAAKESGVDDIAKDINTIARPKSTAMNSLKDAATKFEDWDPLATSKPKAEPEPKGPHTQALSEERAEAARKYSKAAAKKAEERIAREVEIMNDQGTPPKPAEPAATAPAAKKPAAKKPAAKKPTAKKPAAKKTTTTTAAKKTTTTTAAKKTTTTTAKKSPTTAKKAPAKKADS